MIDHPGYLGWTSEGVILIHADWPAYAVEHGLGYALMTLGQFPKGTKFTLLDDIDQCFLFLANGKPQQGNPFGRSNLHVAMWHKDLLELHEAGYVIGAQQLTLDEWVAKRAEELLGMVWKKPDGTIVPVDPPTIEHYEGLDLVWFAVAADGLILTESGFDRLEQLLSEEKDAIHEDIMRRARPAILANLYDSAIREACVIIETRMRELVGTDAYGTELIEQFFRLAQERRLISAQLKSFRTEVRSLFKFVRNEYAHKAMKVERIQCYALLARASNVYMGIQQIIDLTRRG